MLYLLLAVLILELNPYSHIYTFPTDGSICVDQMHLAEAVAIKQQWTKEMPGEPEVSITRTDVKDIWHFVIAGA